MKRATVKKPTTFIRLITLLLLTVFLTACGGEATEEIPMGRYTERDVNLPGSGYEYMHALSDGGYYLHGNGADLTKVDADGKIKKSPWPWEQNYNVRLKTVFGISDTGAAIFAFLPRFYTDEELAVLGTAEEIRYQYYYVDEKGDRRLLKLHGDNYTPQEYFAHFAFSPDGTLYGATERHVCRINLETEEVEPLFETAGMIRSTAFIDNTLLAINHEKCYLYDMAAQKLLSDNTVLNEFRSSHQTTLVLAVGSGADTISQPGGQTAQPSNAEDSILYIACRTGLYRYVWNGTVVEQIADGQMLSLGNNEYTPLAMQTLANGEFRLLFSGNHMVELYYDETIPSRPSKELTVYSLEENARIRYAGQLFQKQNPDVLVIYETGMDGDNAVSREDALRNLNTRLLAGEGPDVLILDGMDIEQYADKGVLKELDDFLLPYKEEGSLYQNIVEGMRMTESQKIYAVPLTVFLPLYLSETKYLDGQTTLPDLISGAKHAREEHPEGPLLFATKPKYLLNQLLPVCLPAWTEDDGSLRTDLLTEFYQTAHTLWKLDTSGMDEARLKRWQEEYDYEGHELFQLKTGVGVWISFHDGEETWIPLSYAQEPFDDMRQIHLTYAGFRETGGYLQFKPLDDVYAMGYGKLGGQAQDVYWARVNTGICEQAKEPELAEAFLTLLLSDDMMRKWWLDDGYPIRKESLVHILDFNNREWAQIEGLSADSVNIWYADYVWPTEEEKEWMYQILEEASCPFCSVYPQSRLQRFPCELKS